jgi:hypothetical protein
MSKIVRAEFRKVTLIMGVLLLWLIVAMSSEFLELLDSDPALLGRITLLELPFLIILLVMGYLLFKSHRS